MLPNGTDPLILADGTMINPEDGSVVKDEPDEVIVEVPNNEELQREIVAARVRLHDLPAPPQQMNSLSVVLSYSLFGVSNEDIATVLHITPEHVASIKSSEIYLTLQNQIVDNIVKSDQDAVRNMFAAQSIRAANRMNGLLDSDSENIQLQAAKDILDRGGHRPADVIEHRHKHEGGLTIQYVESDRAKDIPSTTIEGELDHGDL